MVKGVEKGVGGCCILNHELSSSEVTTKFTSGVIFVGLVLKSCFKLKDSFEGARTKPLEYNGKTAAQYCLETIDFG